jgi:hypothetical protein
MRLSGGESCWDQDDLFYCSGEREVAVVRIQYFSFDLRGEAMGRSVAVIWSGVNELILALWEWSTARHGGVAMLTGGETVPGSGKGEDSSTTKHGRWRFKATVHRTINTFLPRDGIKSICLKILENICSWSSFVHLIMWNITVKTKFKIDIIRVR